MLVSRLGDYNRWREFGEERVLRRVASRSDGHRVLWGLLGSVILICVTAISVLAVCEQPHPRVCTEFYDSAAVFSGEVMTVRDQVYSGGGPPAGWFYRVRVQQSFRGPTGPVIEVYTENSSARFPLRKGRNYLLFARDDEGTLTLTCCGNSDFLEKSGNAIRQIEEIKQAKLGGEIAGRIGWGDSSDFEGVRIVAIGKNHTYVTRTDSKGWFKMRVRVGVYKVETPDRDFWPFDLTYDDPNHVVVQPGGCPQMQFMPTQQE